MKPLPNPLKLLSSCLLWTAFLSSGVVLAESPPDLPLPPCEGPDGEVGACPQTDEDLNAVVSGPLSAGAATSFTIDPQIPVCDGHNGYPPYPWAPSGCYSAIHAPTISGCGYIDLQTNEWKEQSCAGLLYRNSSSAPQPLFSVGAAQDSAGCGGAGDYQTWYHGGPSATDGGIHRWVNKGPTLLGCAITFHGPRPNNLRGPTWVKVRYGIDRADDGDACRGDPKYAETYVRIDGDLREEAVDVRIRASASMRTEGDAKIVTYRISLSNLGEKEAENVRLTTSYLPRPHLGEQQTSRIRRVPRELHLIDISDDRCQPNPIADSAFSGGIFDCQGITLAANGDPLGRDEAFIDIRGRVVNASDLPTLTFVVEAPGDIDESTNEDSHTRFASLPGGSVEQTRQAMAVLDQYFDYRTDIRGSQCNVYRDDIYARFEQIRRDHPEVFENLSYGPITSGSDTTALVGSEAQHVGLVVYPKGTNYHETGIIIHGTPSVSPLGYRAEFFNTQVGAFPLGEQPATARLRGTTGHGYYYRTPVADFPAMPRPEGASGCGFEGLYSDNHQEFARSSRPNCSRPPGGSSCPFTPDAVVVQTESPVDLQISTPDGRQVHTQGDAIALQELGTPIHGMALDHGDGTFMWTLVLPPEDYLIDLIGTGDGPYRLAVTHFNDEGEPVETVHESTTTSGQVDGFNFVFTVFENSFEP